MAASDDEQATPAPDPVAPSERAPSVAPPTYSPPWVPSDEHAPPQHDADLLRVIERGAGQALTYTVVGWFCLGPVLVPLGLIKANAARRSYRAAGMKPSSTVWASLVLGGLYLGTIVVGIVWMIVGETVLGAMGGWATAAAAPPSTALTAPRFSDPRSTLRLQVKAYSPDTSRWKSQACHGVIVRSVTMRRTLGLTTQSCRSSVVRSFPSPPAVVMKAERLDGVPLRGAPGNFLDVPGADDSDVEQAVAVFEAGDLGAIAPLELATDPPEYGDAVWIAVRPGTGLPVASPLRATVVWTDERQLSATVEAFGEDLSAATGGAILDHTGHVVSIVSGVDQSTTDTTLSGPSHARLRDALSRAAPYPRFAPALKCSLGSGASRVSEAYRISQDPRAVSDVADAALQRLQLALSEVEATPRRAVCDPETDDDGEGLNDAKYWHFELWAAGIIVAAVPGPDAERLVRHVIALDRPHLTGAVVRSALEHGFEFPETMIIDWLRDENHLSAVAAGLGARLQVDPAYRSVLSADAVARSAVLRRYRDLSGDHCATPDITPWGVNDDLDGDERFKFTLPLPERPRLKTLAYVDVRSRVGDESRWASAYVEMGDRPFSPAAAEDQLTELVERPSGYVRKPHQGVEADTEDSNDELPDAGRSKAAPKVPAPPG